MTSVVLALVLAQAQWSATGTLERRFETLRYRFENPSSFDTPALVPHFFEQTYDTDNTWIGGAIDYPLFGHTSRFAVRFTPQVTASATDFDTFFQPDGNVVVTGTTGNASLRAWELDQRVTIGQAGGFSYGVGYSYRRDRANYHEGTRITSTTRPVSELRELVTTREYVTSQIHEVHVFSRWQPGAPQGISVLFDSAPVSRARLQVELPDKYPGRLIVFDARASTVAAEARLARRVGAIVATIGLRAGRTIPWQKSARVHLTTVAVLFGVTTR